jgi:hypothetical protein
VEERKEKEKKRSRWHIIVEEDTKNVRALRTSTVVLLIWWLDMHGEKHAHVLNSFS